ncbi:MAG: DNA mismatch repair protein MutS [Acidobacteria bacterium]|nr:DNA mismatch repair protein MutS [Acidobacteriota bacterium]
MSASAMTVPTPSTPLMRQYQAIKKQYPQALVFFRLGDFYELFYEDAKVASRELEITLTARHRERGTPVPMCGVPHHAAESYIARLIRRGYKVAICEQTEEPSKAKKLVKREVVRVITPGTAVDAAVLGPRENNYIASCWSRPEQSVVGLAYADLSTGEFRATEFSGRDWLERLREELEYLAPRELLRPQTVKLTGVDRRPAGPFSFVETPLEDWLFAPEVAERLLREQFGVVALDGFGLAGKPLAVGAAGALVHYLRETQRSTLEHLGRPSFYDQQEALVLDTVSVRNLELIEPLFGNDRSVTVLATLDETVTAAGGRLLKNSLLRPPVSLEEITGRLDSVEELAQETLVREELREALAETYDLERLLSKCTLGTATPRDLLALRQTLELVPRVRQAMAEARAPRLRALCDSLDELADLRERIARAISEEAPASAAESGIIRPGYNAELDELRQLRAHSQQYIAEMEARERRRTGIASLKVRFNNVFGYYIEVSKPNLPRVPPDYERKQTLVNAERFTTPELKEYERKVLSAEEKIAELERRLFVEVRGAVVAAAARLRTTAAALAQLDLLAAFAQLARTRNYVRPEFSPTGELLIVGGRHPVIERLGEASGERFVPNDVYLNDSTDLILLITGPNMGGKSTYLRQAALICLLAQMGSFVPASQARLPILDRIYTRIGASDNLARGRSTFLVEMTEAAAILNTATPRSLVLLDEVGRGTATFDGLAIAWAVVEHLHARTGAKTLFATHYHELTELADLLPGVKNVHVSVKESGSEIVFLHKVQPGSADKSYGIEVAKLAGLPLEVIERARQVLREHEQREEGLKGKLAPAESPAAEQLPLLTPLDHKIVEALRCVDLDQLRPLDALNLLAELKKQLG